MREVIEQRQATACLKNFSATR